jgi:23S rRNA (cytosine1962-C5)-methyltransferase
LAACTSARTSTCASSKVSIRDAGLAHGALREPVTFVEDGLVYRVDVTRGQKTGFYLDQRTNRALVRQLARERTCSTRSPTQAASRSPRWPAARKARSRSTAPRTRSTSRGRNVFAQPVAAARSREWREADAFAELRKLRDRGVTFDLAILDPPKFAPTAAHANAHRAPTRT